MSPTILVLVLLSASLCFGFRVHNTTMVLDVNEHGMMDMVVEGGVLKNGAIIGGNIVYGKYQSHNNSKARDNGRRQATTVVTLWQNSDQGGTFVALTDSTLEYPNLADYSFANEASSMLMATTNYVVNVYTGTSFTGSCWSFRTNAVVGNFDVYSGFNDHIQSVLLIPVPSGAGGSTMYQNSNFGGISVYLPSGTGEYSQMNYPDITDTAAVSGFCGAFPNKALSSVIVLAPGQFQFFPDPDCTGTDGNTYGPGYTSVSQVEPNDKAQSAIAYNFN